MRVSAFALGTGIGIIPKIALTAFAGNSIVKAMKGGGVESLLTLGLGLAVWIGIGWFARKWLRAREAADPKET